MNRSLSVRVPITAVKFYEENTPTKSWHNLPKPTKQIEFQVIEEVRKLFDECPVWGRQAVLYRLSLISNDSEFMVLSNVRL